MKKLGFTLAEVLITLAIIGVIAAMTLPALTSNVQKSQTGPALAKAVNTLENMNRNALVQYNARNLETVIKCIGAEASIDSPKYIDVLNTLVSGAKDADHATNFSYISKDGIVFIMGSFGADEKGAETVTEADWTLVKTGPESDAGNKTADGKYYYKYIPVTIDINGKKTPNILGDDRFLVYIDNGGAVIPAGGNESVQYGTDTAAKTKADCTNTPDDKCTGLIADNGWKVNY